MSTRLRGNSDRGIAATLVNYAMPGGKRLKLEIYTEFHGLEYQKLIDPETGQTVVCTTVNFTPRGWELLGRYCAKSGQTAEEWIGEELKDVYNELLGPEGLEVGDTRIVYPQGRAG